MWAVSGAGPHLVLLPSVHLHSQWDKDRKGGERWLEGSPLHSLAASASQGGRAVHLHQGVGQPPEPSGCPPHEKGSALCIGENVLQKKKKKVQKLFTEIACDYIAFFENNEAIFN